MHLHWTQIVLTIVTSRHDQSWNIWINHNLRNWVMCREMSHHLGNVPLRRRVAKGGGWGTPSFNTNSLVIAYSYETKNIKISPRIILSRPNWRKSNSWALRFNKIKWFEIQDHKNAITGKIFGIQIKFRDFIVMRPVWGGALGKTINSLQIDWNDDKKQVI